MTALVVAPSAWHIAALTGASLARWSAEGRPTVIATPDVDGEGDRLAAVADLLGARSEAITWRESAWTSDEEGRLLLTELVRKVQPSLLLTTPIMGAGPRGRTIGAMTFDAAFCATVPHYVTPRDVPAAGARTAIVELDDPFARNARTVEYVDAASTWETKKRAVESTASWRPGNEFPASAPTPVVVAEVVSRARGVQIQSEHGEAFGQVHVYGRVRAHRLMPN